LKSQNIQHTETDYAFWGNATKTSDKTTFWETDPRLQQSSNQIMPMQLTRQILEVKPPLGPNTANWGR